MASQDHEIAQAVLHLLADELATCLAPRVVELLSGGNSDTSPWLTTMQAIEYSHLPEGTFRKLAACGKIPSHGGRSKLFYRPELDQALLDLDGMADEAGQLRRVR